jgi:hypothetical protein
VEQEKRIILGGSITRFVIEPDASDEEKGKTKREQFIEKLARTNRKRDRKRKAQRKAKTKRKAEAEQTLIHIGDMLLAAGRGAAATAAAATGGGGDGGGGISATTSCEGRCAT